MIINSSVTIYHRNGLDITTGFEKWVRKNYSSVWFFGGKGASINKGYDDANDVEIRLPYESNTLNISDFAIGDIIVKGTLTTDITRQQDLSSYETYNITSITNNDFGNNPHIHIGGK